MRSSTRVLVTGPESAGTKLTSHLLTLAGAEVKHYTPRHRTADKPFLTGEGFDWVVLVIRNSWANAQSMVDNGHAYDNAGREGDLELAYELIPEAIFYTLLYLLDLSKVYVITYESLVHERGALMRMCEHLGLKTNFAHGPIGDGNAKYYGGEYFRDTTPLEERTA